MVEARHPLGRKLPQSDTRGGGVIDGHGRARWQRSATAAASLAPAPIGIRRAAAKDAAAKDAAEDGDATLWELPAYSPRKGEISPGEIPGEIPGELPADSPRKSVSRSAKPRGTAPEKGAKGAQH